MNTLQTTKLIAIIILAICVFAGCKDDTNGSGNPPPNIPPMPIEICQFVGEEEFEALIPIINDFLSEYARIKNPDDYVSISNGINKLCI